MKRKIDSYLGFAKKSRQLLTGYNTCIFGMQKRKIKLLILAEDLAENTIKKLTKLSEASNCPYRIFGTTDELSQITGEQCKGVYGIVDVKFAKVIRDEIDQMK